MAAPRDVIVCTDPDGLADEAADLLVAALTASPAEHPTVCLSGGSTPKRLYERLAREPRRSRIDWQRVHWFWGDERVVPSADPRSNARMAREALLDHVPVPAANIHPVRTDGLSPEAAAAAYDAELRRFYGRPAFDPAAPLFDVMLLGIGPDGHTASLFPGTPGLAERAAWAVANPAGLDPFVPRVTLTYPAIASSRLTLFLVAGADKRPMLARIFGGADVPATHVTSAGRLVWMLDEAAAPEG